MREALYSTREALYSMYLEIVRQNTYLKKIV
jgi:hypothetical protein